jgi:hypothetical protein
MSSYRKQLAIFASIVALSTASLRRLDGSEPAQPVISSEAPSSSASGFGGILGLEISIRDMIANWLENFDKASMTKADWMAVANDMLVARGFPVLPSGASGLDSASNTEGRGLNYYYGHGHHRHLASASGPGSSGSVSESSEGSAEIAPFMSFLGLETSIRDAVANWMEINYGKPNMTKADWTAAASDALAAHGFALPSSFSPTTGSRRDDNVSSGSML